MPTAALALSGLEAMGLFETGQAPAPPIGQLTGVRPVAFGPGSATFAMPMTDWLLAPQGRSYGGVLAILVDAPLGCAIHTTLPAHVAYTTTELAVSMVRPVPLTGTLTAHAKVIYSGRSTAIADAEIVDDDGRMIAHCTTRCAIFPSPFPGSDTDLADIAALPVHDRDYPETAPFRQPARGDVLPDGVWASTSGLEVLQAQIRGELPGPPIGELLGLRPIAAAEGTATFVLPMHGWLVQPFGLVQGGVTACLADSTMAAAVQTTVPAGGTFASLDLRVNYLRPLSPDGRLATANATVRHSGRTVAYAQAEVVNADGKIVAIATASALYR
jgi:uncharacterized protein (TIGR00369 family)